ncbi:MAG: hypothetical protein WDA60_04515 [Acidimicrobiia bacterium]
MGIWAVVVVLGIVFAPVGVQRLRARLWRADRAATRAALAPVHFPQVWFQAEPPRRLATNERVTGELTVDAASGSAVLTVAEGALPITEITGVSIGGRGSDFVGTWVEVHCRVGVKATVAYFNDARWLAWAPVLTGSNLHMADAFAALSDRSDRSDSAD